MTENVNETEVWRPSLAAVVIMIITTVFNV